MRALRKIEWIVVHHSLTPDGPKLSVPAIRHYHTAPKPEGKGWDDIGYHMVIERAEMSIEAVMGRPWIYQGAHARGRNHNSIGVCILGNFDEYPVPPDQWHFAVKALWWLCRYLRLPAERVVGHREVQRNRRCPGEFFDLDRLRREIA